jgi:hypothetical protein
MKISSINLYPVLCRIHMNFTFEDIALIFGLVYPVKNDFNPLKIIIIKAT